MKKRGKWKVCLAVLQEVIIIIVTAVVKYGNICCESSLNVCVQQDCMFLCRNMHVQM